MLGVFERTKQFMKPKIKPAEWAILCAVPTGVCAGYFVSDNRVIFDIGGNKYRLVVHVSYGFSRVLIKFVGTHAEYDKIDPESVSFSPAMPVRAPLVPLLPAA